MKYRIKKRNIIGKETDLFGGEHMTVIKSIAFCVGWIITASIGLWAMAIYGSIFVIRGIR